MRVQTVQAACSLQDSSEYAGYEEAIDDYAAQAAGAASKGTKRVSSLLRTGNRLPTVD